jgi:hypothetical protein
MPKFEMLLNRQKKVIKQMLDNSVIDLIFFIIPKPKYCNFKVLFLKYLCLFG